MLPSRAARVRRLAAMTSNDAIIAKDLNGIIQSANAVAERLFGYAPAELIGRILIPPDRLAEEDEILAPIRRGERIDHFEKAHHPKPIDSVALIATVASFAELVRMRRVREADESRA
jgi:PAS domain-containing protein